jgi:hypothetical protein
MCRKNIAFDAFRIFLMNAKYKKTLERVFQNPVPANIKWRDIETMLVSMGAEIREGNGSRIRVRLNGVITTFHRPHPSPDTKKGAVLSVRKFIVEAGIK